MIKTAVIGYGFSARTFHLPFLSNLPVFSPVALSTSQTEAAKAAWPNLQVYPTAESLINETEADLVIITAPNNVHFSLAKQALEQNKHVIVEKPFVTSVADGEVLVRLAAERERLLSVYHNRRWDGDFLTVRKLVISRTLGEIRFFESHFDRFRPQVRPRWREQPGDGAGIWYDLGSHLVDQALSLFGMPQTVSGRCLAMRPNSEVTDYFHVQLHYPTLEVILHGSLYAAGPNLRFYLQGTEGSYIKYGVDPQEDQLKAGHIPTSAGWASEEVGAYGTKYTADGFYGVATEVGGYEFYFRAIARALLSGAAVPVPATEALDTIRVIEAALESSNEGRTVTLA